MKAEPYHRRVAIIGSVCLTLSCLAGRNSKESALKIIRCDLVVEPLLTNTYTLTSGPGAFACVRMETATAAKEAMVHDHCVLARKPLEPAIYPWRSIPMTPPKWWDLADGDAVGSSTTIDFDGDWEGFTFRKMVGGKPIWFMCAGYL